MVLSFMKEIWKQEDKLTEENNKLQAEINIMSDSVKHEIEYMRDDLKCKRDRPNAKIKTT